MWSEIDRASVTAIPSGKQKPRSSQCCASDVSQRRWDAGQVSPGPLRSVLARRLGSTGPFGLHDAAGRTRRFSHRDRGGDVPDDEARPPGMIRRLTGRASVMLGLSLVCTTTATVVVARGPVAADQVSDLKTQANQIAKDLVLEQLQIGTYQQQYDVDGAKLQQVRAEIGSTQHQIQAEVVRVSRDRERLQSEAVAAYINMDPQVNGSQ